MSRLTNSTLLWAQKLVQNGKLRNREFRDAFHKKIKLEGEDITRDNDNACLKY